MLCSGCGSSVEDYHNYSACCSQQLSSQQDSIEKELIELYFFSGYEYEVIVEFLGKYHDIRMPLSTLTLRLKGIWFKAL